VSVHYGWGGVFAALAAMSGAAALAACVLFVSQKRQAV
jgi:sugar phosphate permease